MKRHCVFGWIALFLGSICLVLLLLSFLSAVDSFSEWSPFIGFTIIHFFVGPILAIAAIVSGVTALVPSAEWDMWTPYDRHLTVFSLIGICGGGLVLIGIPILLFIM